MTLSLAVFEESLTENISFTLSPEAMTFLTKKEVIKKRAALKKIVLTVFCENMPLRHWLSCSQNLSPAKVFSQGQTTNVYPLMTALCNACSILHVFVVIFVFVSFLTSTYLQWCTPGSEDKGQYDCRHVFTCGWVQAETMIQYNSHLIPKFCTSDCIS